jgi:glycosyltransferase involved in cell wall biosynthesis
MLKRVVIDGRLQIPSGIARYTHGLLAALTRCAPEIEFILLTHRATGMAAENLREIEVAAEDHSASSALTLHRLIDSMQADLVHSTFTLTPLFLSTPSIVTVHDLMAVRAPGLIHPGFTRHLQPLYLRPWFRHSVRRARVVLTPTEAVAADVRLHFARHEPSIVVTGEGVGPEFVSTRPPRSARKYILAYGNARPYKNLPKLIEAFALFTERVSDVALVVLGRMPEIR